MCTVCEALRADQLQRVSSPCSGTHPQRSCCGSQFMPAAQTAALTGHWRHHRVVPHSCSLHLASPVGGFSPSPLSLPRLECCKSLFSLFVVLWPCIVVSEAQRSPPSHPFGRTDFRRLLASRPSRLLPPTSHPIPIVIRKVSSYAV